MSFFSNVTCFKTQTQGETNGLKCFEAISGRGFRHVILVGGLIFSFPPIIRMVGWLRIFQRLGDLVNGFLHILIYLPTFACFSPWWSPKVGDKSYCSMVIPRVFSSFIPLQLVITWNLWTLIVLKDARTHTPPEHPVESGWATPSRALPSWQTGSRMLRLGAAQEDARGGLGSWLK